jgi:hypothetical protein
MRTLFLTFFLLACLTAFAQNQPNGTPGMDMSHADASGSREMHGMPGMDGESNAAAMRSMEGHHMDMGPHMKMTALRPIQPGDQQKADEVARAAKAVAEKYKDYKLALADGYKIFLPNVPQKQYHFTNYGNAFRARQEFDPSQPTSLLYEKTGDGYKLIGIMYTAKRDASEDELNSRIPLSIAQWHAHVNLCLPRRDKNNKDVFPPGTKFGLRGSIATKEACDAAGGRFIPQVFGWMVHVYPFEKNTADVWSVERQAGHMD